MARLDKRLEEVSIEATERDHGIGVGLFFDDAGRAHDPAITYYGGDDPRRTTS